MVFAVTSRAVADGGDHGGGDGHDPSPAPRIVLVAPSDGSVFKAGFVGLEALARDPMGGPIVKLDFVANDVVVASSDRSGEIFPAIVGLTLKHKAAWTNPPAGFSRILARAKVRDTNVESGAIGIWVGMPVYIGVIAADPLAGEGTPANPGTFRILRSAGPDARPELKVGLKWEGTALNGVDYAALPDEAVIPQGAEHVDVTVTPLLDNLSEGPESVVLSLVSQTPPAGQPASYAIGHNGRATIVIADAPKPLPVVKLVAPIDGAKFITGDPIPLEAAIDPADGVRRVAFWSLAPTERLLLVATNPPYSGFWSNAPTGPHAIIAVAHLGDGRTVTSSKAAIEVGRPVGSAPTLVWTSPADGLQVVAGTPVTFSVTGTDPLGVIPSVKFAVDGKPVGTGVAPDGATAGSPVTYAFAWTPTIQVDRKLSARAVTSDGVVLEVAGPTIHVVAPAIAPKVTVTATGAEVDENDAAGRLVFRIDRDGPTTSALTVSYVLTGKATYGIDYVPAKANAAGLADEGHSGFRQSATIAAGESSVTIRFAPVADRRTEGDETVVLALLAPNGKHGLVPAYVPGDPSSASGVIHDTVVPPAELPVISIVATTAETSEPAHGGSAVPAVLTLVREGPTNRPVKVFYAVSGTAANGHDYRFLDGDAVIPAGEARREIRVVPFFDRAVEGDETVVLTLRTNRAYGVKDPSSATATIHEGTVSTKASLVLTAPVDGAKGTNPTVLALAADVTDPKGYVATVDFVADGAVIGTSTLVFIQAPKPGTTLHHSFDWKNPPAGKHVVSARAVTADGTQLESNVASIEILPAPQPPTVSRHPADSNPADDVLADDEVSAYSAAWLAGTPFATGPSPVPVGYATRAGYLLGNGGGYKFDASAGSLPLAWISTVVVVVPPVDPSGAISHAITEVPDITPATPFVLTVRIVPLDGVRAQAVEETVGVGAVVTDISDGGVYDAAAGVIRWGVYLDDTTRKVTATVTVPDARDLSGLASFDGADIRIPQVPPPPPLPGASLPSARIASVIPLESGAVQLTVVDESSTGDTAIEVSTDLLKWERVEQVQASGDTSTHVDSDADENFRRFYRLVPVPR